MKYFAIYLLTINAIAVIVAITDKIKARMSAWRIPEKTLIIIGLIGGAVGMYATMLIIRHKTKHKKFTLGLPLIILLQCAALIMISRCIT